MSDNARSVADARFRLKTKYIFAQDFAVLYYRSRKNIIKEEIKLLQSQKKIATYFESGVITGSTSIILVPPLKMGIILVNLLS